jgi:methyl-accepting chemotaxis protein
MRPAIHLMNRLNYTSKFALINVLWLIPIVWLFTVVTGQLGDSIDEVSDEIQGLSYYEQVRQLEQSLRTYRDFHALASQRSVADFDNQANNAKAEVDAQLDALLAKAKRESFVAFDEQLVRLQAAWQQLQTSPPNELDVVNQHRSYTDLFDESRAATTSLLRASKLILDSDLEVNTLITLNKDTINEVLMDLSAIRALGVFALNEGSLNFQVSDELNNLYDSLATKQNALENAFIQTASLFDAEGKELQTQLNDKILASLSGLDNDIINPIQLERSWQSFNTDLSAAMTASESLSQKIDNALLASLTFRLDQQTSYRFNLFVLQSLLLIVIFYLYTGFSMSVRSAIANFSLAAKRVAEGDLTVILKKESQDELGALSDSFNDMTDQVKQLIEHALLMTAQVADQANNLNKTAQSNRDAVTYQQQETEQISISMKDMVSAVSEVAANTQHTSDTASSAQSQANQGKSVVDTTVATIGDLAREIEDSVKHINRVNEDSDEISQALVEIKAIADQTNLLALNAAIEAARAGEQGRGFAVVADEVRSLSQRTQKSTVEIESMIDKLQKGVHAAVTSMNKSHVATDQTVDQSKSVAIALDEIVAAVEGIVNMSLQIAAAAEQQSVMTSNVQQNVSQIANLGNETMNNADSALGASNQLIDNTKQLENLIEKFKVS